MKYTAKSDTFLKKSPVQASTLEDSEKVPVAKGNSYLIKKLLATDNLHSQVELDSQAEPWWIFLPHWDTVSDLGEVKANFSLKQATSTNLIYGKLVFTSDGEEILSVKATSGLAGFQYRGAHDKRGKGCLPPRKDWKISTAGYYSSTQGIEGQFYHITPDPDPGTRRGEFGLHRDANVPGSSGCIVVTDIHDFRDKVQPLLDGLRNKQAYIPLNINYT